MCKSLHIDIADVNNRYIYIYYSLAGPGTTRYLMTKTKSSTKFLTNLFHYSCSLHPYIQKVRPSDHCFSYLKGDICNDSDENRPISKGLSLFGMKTHGLSRIAQQTVTQTE